MTKCNQPYSDWIQSCIPSHVSIDSNEFYSTIVNNNIQNRDVRTWYGKVILTKCNQPYSDWIQSCILSHVSIDLNESYSTLVNNNIQSWCTSMIWKIHRSWIFNIRASSATRLSFDVFCTSHAYLVQINLDWKSAYKHRNSIAFVSNKERDVHGLLTL